MLCEQVRLEVRGELEQFLVKWNAEQLSDNKMFGGRRLDSNDDPISQDSSLRMMGTGENLSLQGTQSRSAAASTSETGESKADAVKAQVKSEQDCNQKKDENCTAEQGTKLPIESQAHEDSTNEKHDGKVNKVESEDQKISKAKSSKKTAEKDNKSADNEQRENAARVIQRMVRRKLHRLKEGSGTPAGRFKKWDNFLHQHRVHDLFYTKGLWKEFGKEMLSDIKALKHEQSISDRVKKDALPFDGFLNKLVRSEYFEYSVAVLIMVNAVLVGIQVNEQSKNWQEEYPPGFFGVLETLFLVIFVVELLVRVYVYRWRFIFSNHFQVNVFDTVVLTAAVIDEVAKLATNRPFTEANMVLVRVLRILRLARFVRKIRVHSMFHDLRVMLLSILASFTTLIWAGCILLMFTYIVSIYLTKTVADHVRKNPDAINGALYQNFGTIPNAMLTLYMAISGGGDWGDLAEPLIAEVSPFYSVLFVLYTGFTLFALLNVVTGVFVESALSAAQSDKDFVIQDQIAKQNSYVHQVRQLFKEADEDGSGQVSWAEFQTHLTDVRVTAYFKALELDIAEAQGLFRLLDMDDTGAVDAEEFVMGCLRLKGQAKSVDVATLIYENKRMAHKWNFFMRYVEESFQRLGQTIDAAFSTGNAEHLRMEVGEWEHTMITKKHENTSSS